MKQIAGTKKEEEIIIGYDQKIEWKEEEKCSFEDDV